MAETTFKTEEQANLIAMAKNLQSQLSMVINFVESAEFQPMTPRERCLWTMEFAPFHFTAGDFAITCIKPWLYKLPEARN